MLANDAVLSSLQPTTATSRPPSAWNSRSLGLFIAVWSRCCALHRPLNCRLVQTRVSAFPDICVLPAAQQSCHFPPPNPTTLTVLFLSAAPATPPLMISAFTPALRLVPPSRRVRRRAQTAIPSACRLPPRPPRRTRVPREHTSHSQGWQWPGRRHAPPPPPPNWPSLSEVEASVLKVLRAVSAAPLLVRMARVLRSVTSAVARALVAPPPGPAGVEYEYGLAEPDDDDALFVDPLSEWELGGDPFYRDSCGRPVYLHLTTSSGIVAATDFRDVFEEARPTEDDEGSPPTVPPSDVSSPVPPNTSSQQPSSRPPAVDR